MSIVVSMALGLTVGLLAGMSQSPVVASLISGLLGLIGGGVVSLFVWRKTGILDADGEALTAISGEHVKLVSQCLLAICVATIVGGILGILLRQSELLAYPFKPLPLVPVTSEGIGGTQVAKLVLLQQELQQHGVSSEKNNEVIQMLTLELKSGEDIGLDIDLLLDQLLSSAGPASDRGNTSFMEKKWVPPTSWDLPD